MKNLFCNIKMLQPNHWRWIVYLSIILASLFSAYIARCDMDSIGINSHQFAHRKIEKVRYDNKGGIISDTIEDDYFKFPDKIHMEIQDKIAIANSKDLWVYHKSTNEYIHNIMKNCYVISTNRFFTPGDLLTNPSNKQITVSKQKYEGKECDAETIAIPASAKHKIGDIGSCLSTIVFDDIKSQIMKSQETEYKDSEDKYIMYKEIIKLDYPDKIDDSYFYPPKGAKLVTKF